MIKAKSKLIAIVFTSIALSLVAKAQSGPFVPCEGCDSLTQASYPETGSWYNPEQSGSGLNLEIQNGFLVGYYYGYDAEGQPEWQLITGDLVTSQVEGVLWELDTILQRFEGGNCVGCEYQPPNDPTDGPGIKLEFLQRNYMRLTLGENEAQFYVPIMFGTVGARFFNEQTPYIFPDYGANLDPEEPDNPVPFFLIFKPQSEGYEPWEWRSYIVQIYGGGFIENGPEKGKLLYDVIQELPAETYPVGSIECSLDQDTEQPGCKFIANLLGGGEYNIPIGFLGDSRFFGEAADGATVEGYRLDYD